MWRQAMIFSHSWRLQERKKKTFIITWVAGSTYKYNVSHSLKEKYVKRKHENYYRWWSGHIYVMDDVDGYVYPIIEHICNQ